MAVLTPTEATTAGAEIAFVAADGAGDSIPPSPHGVLLVANGSAASVDVTIVDPGRTPLGVDNPDADVAVPAGATVAIGPFSQVLADLATDSLVDVTYSATTDVTVAFVEAG